MSATTAIVEDRLEMMAAQLTELTAEMRRQREQRDVVADLAHDLSPVARQAMDTITARLADMQERGHIDFAVSALGVLDRIVTEFDAHDVEALGDNIVLILLAVREMTQPEIMTMLRRTAHVVNDEADHAEHEAPGAFHLLREMRDPDVRRGLSRVLTVLRSVGDQDDQDPASDTASPDDAPTNDH